MSQVYVRSAGSSSPSTSATSGSTRVAARARRVGVTAMLALVRDGMAWAQDGACRQVPLERADDFHVPDHYRGRTPTSEAVQAARRYCAHCPVLAECEDFAELASRGSQPLTGVWGGQWLTLTGTTPITTKAVA